MNIFCSNTIQILFIEIIDVNEYGLEIETML